MMQEDENYSEIPSSPVEIESAFILRLPPAAAFSLRSALRSGAKDVQDRLQIKIEETDEMQKNRLLPIRKASVQFDNCLMRAKLYNLPTVVECYKTLDRKMFYKVSDICQLMLCREEDEGTSEDDEETRVKLDKEGREKRYLYPHGVSACLKNVRKRRFRKTLRKSYSDQPSVEKEVKMLLTTDEEAISTRFELVNIEDEKSDAKNMKPNVDNTLSNSSAAKEVTKSDIFGEVSSSSDDSDSEGSCGSMEEAGKHLLMALEAIGEESEECAKNVEQPSSSFEDTNVLSLLESEAAEVNLDKILKKQQNEEERSELFGKLNAIEQELLRIQTSRQAQINSLVDIENTALRHRLQSNIDRLWLEEQDKRKEYNDIVNAIENM